MIKATGLWEISKFGEKSVTFCIIHQTPDSALVMPGIAGMIPGIGIKKGIDT